MRTNILEVSLSFFFLGNKGGNRLNLAKWFLKRGSTYPEQSQLITINDVKKNRYDIQVRRGFGLGFLISFIPGTGPFKARMDYLNSVLGLDEYITSQIKLIEREPLKINVFRDLSLKSVTSPLYFLRKFFNEWDFVFRGARSNIFTNRKRSLAQLFNVKHFCSLPFMEERGITLDEYAFLLGSYFGSNPATLVSALLVVAHRVVDSLIELGSTEDTESTGLRVVLKSISAAFFISFRLPVVTLQAAIDSFWKLWEQ